MCYPMDIAWYNILHAIEDKMFKTIRLVIFWAKILKYIKNSTSLYKNFNFNIVHIILLFVWSRFRWNSWTLFSNQPIKFTVRSFVIILNYIKIIEITNKRFVVLIYGINSPLTNFLLRCVCSPTCYLIWHLHFSFSAQSNNPCIESALYVFCFLN